MTTQHFSRQVLLFEYAILGTVLEYLARDQLEGEKKSQPLLQELVRLIEKYQPDCIGLNEILRASDSGSAFVLDFLKTHGYNFWHFALASPLTNSWFIGTALCSKYPLESVEEIIMGNDAPAKRRGYEGHTVKAIAAKIKLQRHNEIGIIVAHPMHLRPYTLPDHYQHTKALSLLLQREDYAKNTVIVGDFNEPGFMPKSFAKTHKASLHYRTGSLLKPTWRHKASGRTPIRANLDKLFWTKAGSLKLQSFQVIDAKTSDHRPLFARFQI